MSGKILRNNDPTMILMIKNISCMDALLAQRNSRLGLEFNDAKDIEYSILSRMREMIKRLEAKDSVSGDFVAK